MKRLLLHLLIFCAVNVHAQHQFTGSFLGTAGIEEGYGIAIRNDKVYISGVTSDPTFPATPGAIQDTLGGSYDAFVSCFDTTGTLLWSTFLGGSNYELNPRIEISQQGILYVTGYTSSADFPITPGALQTQIAGSYDVFLVSIDTNGVLLWSTYYGGTGGDLGIDLTTDPAGNPIVGGQSTSPDLPVTVGAFQDTLGGATDAFAAKFSPAGVLIWATYLGGVGSEDVHAIATDYNGQIVISGMTNSGNFHITPNAYQNSLSGFMDVYFTRFNSSGTPVWSTYLGGTNFDDIIGLACDSTGAVFGTGRTNSNDFPVTTNAWQSTLAGGYDAVLVKFDINGNFVFSTYIGGTGDETGTRIRWGNDNRIYISVDTENDSLPAIGPSIQPGHAGNYDLWLLKTGAVPDTLFSTYFGNTMAELTNGLAVENAHVVFAGTSYSNSLPFSNNPWQPAQAGQGDVYWGMIRNSYELPVDTTDTSGVTIHEDFAGDAFFIYPNPAMDYIDIKSPFATHDIAIIDLHGKVILKSGKSTRIDLSPLTPGIYFVQVMIRERTYTRKLVVQ